MSDSAQHQTLWRDDLPLVLASRSATRAALLRAALIPIESMPADIDEREEEACLIAAGAGPAQVASGLARVKALALSKAHPGRLVLGADQTLGAGGQLVHKAVDKAAAAARIASLAGGPHHLHSGAALAENNVILFETVCAATLWMRPLNAGQISLYCDLAGPALLSSVGAYQLEGLGSHLFDRVEGDHFTILGLPLFPLLDAFRRLGRLAL
jgi:septum formation protein